MRIFDIKTLGRGNQPQGGMGNPWVLPTPLNNPPNTVVNQIQRMIQFNVRISILQILITFIYGAIDDLYQENTHFSKLKLFFFHTLY